MTQPGRTSVPMLEDSIVPVSHKSDLQGQRERAGEHLLCILTRCRGEEDSLQILCRHIVSPNPPLKGISAWYINKDINTKFLRLQFIMR